MLFCSCGNEVAWALRGEWWHDATFQELQAGNDVDLARGRVDQGKRGDRSRGEIACEKPPTKFLEWTDGGMLSLPVEVEVGKVTLSWNGNAKADKGSGRLGLSLGGGGWWWWWWWRLPVPSLFRCVALCAVLRRKLTGSPTQAARLPTPL